MRFPRSFSLSRHYERLHINPRYAKNKGRKDFLLSDDAQPSSSAPSSSTATTTETGDNVGASVIGKLQHSIFNYTYNPTADRAFQGLQFQHKKVAFALRNADSDP